MATDAKEIQRGLQKLVRDLRAQGKSDKEIKLAKVQFKRKLKKPDQPVTGKHARWRQHGAPRPLTEAQRSANEREEKGRQHDLIVIPIFWKQREQERESVLDACANIKRALANRGINVWIDQRTKYTPGQKYAYWEHLGVPVRVEVGPRELGAAQVTVSYCDNPGTVARRWPGVSIAHGIKDVCACLEKECRIKLKPARDASIEHLPLHELGGMIKRSEADDGGDDGSKKTDFRHLPGAASRAAASPFVSVRQSVHRDGPKPSHVTFGEEDSDEDDNDSDEDGGADSKHGAASTGTTLDAAPVTVGMKRPAPADDVGGDSLDVNYAVDDPNTRSSDSNKKKAKNSAFKGSKPPRMW